MDNDGMITGGRALDAPKDAVWSSGRIWETDAFQDHVPQAGETWRAGVWALFPSSDPVTGDAVAKVRIEFFDDRVTPPAPWIFRGAADSLIVDGASAPRDVYFQLSVSAVVPVLSNCFSPRISPVLRSSMMIARPARLSTS